MALRVPTRRRPGTVTRGVLEDALQQRKEEIESGAINIPVNVVVPAGTGFRHVTGSIEDANAKLVDTADINPNQVTFAKLQESSAEAVVIGRGEGLGPGEFEELTFGAGLEVVATEIRATAQATTFSYLWQSKTPAQTITGDRFHPDREGTILWVRLEVVLADGLATAEVDVLKNGATIFTVAAPPTVGAGNYLSAEVTPDDVDFDKTDYFQVQALNTGSTEGALRLLIHFTEVLP